MNKQGILLKIYTEWKEKKKKRDKTEMVIYKEDANKIIDKTETWKNKDQSNNKGEIELRP